MHIGGLADFFYELTDIDELPALIQAAQNSSLPIFMLGGGSNTVFADEGFRGLVIHLKAHKIFLEEKSLRVQHTRAEATPLLVAEAGALLSQVIQFALKNNLSGMEKLMGLPGTIGGAVRGNAGAFGTEIKDVFAKALLCHPQKGLYEATKEDLNFGYRFSAIKKSQVPILKVWLRLEKASNAQVLKEALDTATDIVKNRISKQPKGHCSGSFFKNPDPAASTASAPLTSTPHNSTGYLLEKAGCKNLQIGQIKVSAEHANWLINLHSQSTRAGTQTGAKTGSQVGSETGTQKDLIALCQLLQKKVKDQFGISLEPEVQLVGPTGFLELKI